MSQLGAQVLSHVVRKSIEYSNRVDDPLEQQARAWEELDYKFPTWGFYLIAGTLFFFGLQILKVQYTVGHVVSTLAMIEEPSSTMIIETKATETYTDDKEPDATLEKAPLIDVEQTIQTIPNKPITSKIRTTLKHLSAQGGWTTRYRGLGIGIFYMGLRLWTMTLLTAVLPFNGPVAQVLVAGLSAVLLSPIHCIWTHSTITKPVPMRLSEYASSHAKQMPLRALLLPSFVAAVMAEASIQLTAVTTALLADEGIIGAGSIEQDWRLVLSGYATVVTVSVFTLLFCMLPSLVVLKRVEASLLPDEFETLVPFDRSFGGALEPAIVGMGAMARMKAARHSLGRDQLRRVVKVYVKATVIAMVLAVVAVHAVVFEMWAIMGDAFSTLVLAGHAQLRQLAQSP